MQTLTANFAFEADTKNKRRFKEQVADGATPLVGTLYLDKTQVPEGTPSVTATFALAAVVATATEA